MKNHFYCFVIFILCGQPLVFSQYFYNNQYFDSPLAWEAGISTGVMNCFTDLGGRAGAGKPFIKDLNWNQFRFCGGAYAGFLYNYVIGARLEATVGRVAADDGDLKNDNSVAKHRYRRNLHFRSSITELALTGEFHPLAWLANLHDRELPLFSPYLLAGIGLFHFNPEAKLAGNWVRLQPLRTEGQGFIEHVDRLPYRLTQFNFPAGIGIKYEISALLTTRIELVHRALLTDYLDDVSTQYIDPAVFYRHMDRSTAAVAEQLADRRRAINTPNNAPLPASTGATRGNPGNKDAYFSINCKLGFVLSRRRM